MIILRVMAGVMVIFVDISFGGGGWGGGHFRDYIGHFYWLFLKSTTGICALR